MSEREVVILSGVRAAENGKSIWFLLQNHLLD